jgi:hypothetical protein
MCAVSVCLRCFTAAAGQILGDKSGTSLVNSWVGVLVVLLAIVMNEGAVDSLQNGLAASISGQYLKNAPLLWTR